MKEIKKKKKKRNAFNLPPLEFVIFFCYFFQSTHIQHTYNTHAYRKTKISKRERERATTGSPLFSVFVFVCVCVCVCMSVHYVFQRISIKKICAVCWSLFFFFLQCLRRRRPWRRCGSTGGGALMLTSK